MGQEVSGANFTAIPLGESRSGVLPPVPVCREVVEPCFAGCLLSANTTVVSAVHYPHGLKRRLRVSIVL